METTNRPADTTSPYLLIDGDCYFCQINDDECPVSMMPTRF